MAFFSWWWKNKERRCREFLASAVIIGVVALVLVAVGFGTHNWTVVKVDRKTLKDKATASGDTAYLQRMATDYNYFDRWRGLFEMCFSDTPETDFLKTLPEYDSGKCLYEPGLNKKQPPNRETWGNDYKTRNELLRAHVALLAVSMGLVVLALLIALPGFCFFNSVIFFSSAIVSIIGFCSAFSAMIIFHVYDDKETYNLFYFPYIAEWEKDVNLKENSTVRYDYSFYLAWVGTALFLVSSMLLWAAAATWLEQLKVIASSSSSSSEYDHKNKPKRRQYRHYEDDPYYSSYYSQAGRNPYSGMLMLMGNQRNLTPSMSSLAMAPVYNPYDYYDSYGYGGAYPY